VNSNPSSPQRADEEYRDGTRNFWEGATSAPTPVVYVNEAAQLTQSAPIAHTVEQTNMSMMIPEITNGVMRFAQWHEADMPIGDFFSG